MSNTSHYLCRYQYLLGPMFLGSHDSDQWPQWVPYNIIYNQVHPVLLLHIFSDMKMAMWCIASGVFSFILMLLNKFGGSKLHIHALNHRPISDIGLYLNSEMDYQITVSKRAIGVYRKTSSISRTKFQSLNVSCVLLQLSSLNPLKPGVKLRMKM